MSTVTLDDIQLFLARETKDSTTFQALCTTLLGEQLNYYKGGDVRRPMEQMPYFASYKLNQEDRRGRPTIWHVQFVIAIDATADFAGGPTLTDGIFQYNTDSTIELLARGAITAIETALCNFGIGGDLTLEVMNKNILITEVGEATDMQAIVTLQIENKIYLEG